jgi:hypothetical protein
MLIVRGCPDAAWNGLDVEGSAWIDRAGERTMPKGKPNIFVIFGDDIGSASATSTSPAQQQSLWASGRMQNSVPRVSAIVPIWPAARLF